jgi:hypothetical protein
LRRHRKANHEGSFGLGIRRIITALGILATLICAGVAKADSGNRQDKYAFTSFYTMYSQSGLSSGSGAAGSGSPAPSLDVEFAIRLQTIFNLTLLYSRFQTPDSSNTAQLQDNISGYGLGMKIDLPGFFFIGGKREQSEREGKLHPVNSFLFGEILRSTLVDAAAGTTTTSTTPRYGFGFDLFLFNPYVYLSLKLSLLNLLGATYLGAGAGLGCTF